MADRTELGGRTSIDNRTELGGRTELGPFGVNPLLNLITKYGVPAFLLNNSEVYTDALGTLPAGVGDVGGNAADHSGGSHDITQAVTAEKPILRAGPLLEFDGVDDLLSGTNPFTGDEITVITCLKYRTAPASSKTYFSAGDSADAANYISLFANASGNVQSFMTGNITTAGIFNVIHTVSTPVTNTGIVTTRGKANVQEVGWNQDRTATAVATTPVLENADMFTLGALLRITASGWSDIDEGYVFAINKYLPTSELETAEAYIAGICGVTL